MERGTDGVRAVGRVPRIAADRRKKVSGVSVVLTAGAQPP